MDHHPEGMVLNAQRIEFSSFQDMAAHLDRWAGSSLTGPEAWSDALISSAHWLDYSARNQVLLASYGVDGPVAGSETWRLVPSTIEGRPCAVRAGEHGYPVRVPITTQSTEPDPYLGGHRPTRAAVERWEWRPVFSVGQLARRPGPDALVPRDLPADFSGADAPEEYLVAVRKVATTTVRGRLPRSKDPEAILGDAASRLPRSAKRPELEPVLRGQVAWLVADRVGLPPGAIPSFDPGPLPARERWERLQDVLEPARKLTAALGVVTGVDLCASPLPRMEVVDDRVVPAGRRHRLPAASFDRLPVGVWVEVGPYSPDEWAGRGEMGAGRGAYLRLNQSAYLVAVETGSEAAWRLEDVGSRTGHGQLTRGTASTLADAQFDAVATVRSRYPVLSPTGDRPLAARLGGDAGWQPMPGDGDSSAQMRRLDDHTTLYAIPAPGGRWMPAIAAADDTMRRLSSVPTLDAARESAERAGHRASRAAAARSPVQIDAAVAELAASDDYSRRNLQAVVGKRLLPVDRELVAAADAPTLVELLGQAGVTPASTVAVLRSENLDANDVAPLLPSLGVPIPDGIRVLHERWGLDRTDAAGLLDATGTEMREAGCTPVEIMASRPRDVLRTLPDDPHLWELAAGTMATAGHSSAQVAAHLVAHAPTADSFAAGLTTITSDPTEGLGLAAHYLASAQNLAAASERYGLSPAETATILADTGAPADLLVETLWHRCDHDMDAATQLAVDTGHVDASAISRTAEGIGITALAMRGITPGNKDQTRPVDVNDADALLAALPDPVPSASTFDPARLEELVESRTVPGRHLSGAQP